MDKVILTPRLRLILFEDGGLGSTQLEHIHIARSSPEAMTWSIIPASKSLEETQGQVQGMLPRSDNDQHVRKYLATYLIYKRKPDDNGTGHPKYDASDFIGTTGLFEPRVYGVPLATQLFPFDYTATEREILKLELGYMTLPSAWGNGYAPEAVSALVKAVYAARASWNPPYERLFVHAIVGRANTQSTRVLEKVGFKKLGLHEWDGPHVLLGGAMQPPSVWVFGYEPVVASAEGV